MPPDPSGYQKPRYQANDSGFPFRPTFIRFVRSPALPTRTDEIPRGECEREREKGSIAWLAFGLCKLSRQAPTGGDISTEAARIQADVCEQVQ